MARSMLFHYPSSNTAAVITLAAATGSSRQVLQLAWSYDGDPTGGRLSVTDGGTTIFDIDITSGGPGFIPTPIRANSAAALVVTLAAGGSGITGKLNAWV